MTLSGEKWLRTMLMALAVIIAPTSTCSVLGQGFGPDPFRPYNSQYLPYTYPMGPASPGAGQRGAYMGMGNSSANQYQGYLDELSGAGRQGNERYGIGMPYYRSAIDPAFDPNGTRDYRPNRAADRPFEETNEVITRKYLAYFSEKDPKKRAELLRDYNRTRSRFSRALSGRREEPSRILDAATGAGAERRRSTAATEADERRPTGGSPRSSSGLFGREPATEPRRRAATGAIPPPPPLSGVTTPRRTTPRRTPNDVLDRSHRLDRGNDVKPSAGGPLGADSVGGRQPLPLPPPPE